MASRRQQFSLGLFVVGSFALLGVLVVLFGGRTNLFVKRDQFFAIFEDARGVGVGTPVRRSGVRVGEVKAMELEDAGTVKLTLAIDPRYPPRKSEEPVISRELLSGDATIDFVSITPEPKEIDRSFFTQGDIIAGKSPIDPRVLMNQAVEIIPTAQQSLDQIRKSVQRLERLEPKFDEALELVTRLASSSRELVPEIRRSNDQFQKLVKTLNDAAPDLRRTNEDLQVLLVNSNKVVEQVNVLLTTNQKSINDSVRQLNDVLTSLNSVLSKPNQDNLAVTLKNVCDISEDSRPIPKDLDNVLKEGEKLVKDSQQLVQQLQSTAREIDRTLADVRKVTTPLSENVGPLTRNLTDISSQATFFLTDVRELLRGAARGEGSVQKLLTDPALYNNLNSIVVNVNRLGPSLERILHDAEVFADKLARHPELLGIRGAIRPDSGLKETPHVPTAYPYNSPLLQPVPFPSFRK